MKFDVNRPYGENLGDTQCTKSRKPFLCSDGRGHSVTYMWGRAHVAVAASTPGSTAENLVPQSPG